MRLDVVLCIFGQRVGESTAQAVRRRKLAPPESSLQLALMRPLVLSTALFVVGCAGESGLPSTHIPTAEVADETTPAPEPLPEGALRRADVHEVVRKGVGAFLQHVELDTDHPAFENGQFKGFRILALRGDFWRGVDLRPGDVVTRVNGFPLAHPEDAQQALESLDVASELRVRYERAGEVRELRYGIVDAPAAAQPAPR